MIVDIDPRQIEMVIISRKRVIFSRAFKFSRLQPGWEGQFIGEINKTRDAYLKETNGKAPEKIIVTAAEGGKDFAQALNKEAGVTAEILSYDKIGLSDNLLNKISASDSSLASIIGLGLKDLDESLNLLPSDIKEDVKKSGRQKETLRLVVFISGIILVLALATAKTLNNKELYLRQLKIELDKITQEAKPLEEIEKRLEFIEHRSGKGISSLGILYGVQKSMPSEVYLVNLTYEQDKHVILQGQAMELNRVFEFVSQLERSPVFKNFNIKVRYATKKRIQTGEVIDFEIVCLKR